jgi:hypothetical protein
MIGNAVKVIRIATGDELEAFRQTRSTLLSKASLACALDASPNAAT